MKKKLTAKQLETRARKAEKLLSDKMFIEGFELTREAIQRDIENLPPTDIESLVICKTRLHLLRSIEENVRQAIRDGQLARFRSQEDELPPLGDIVEWRRKRQAQN